MSAPDWRALHASDPSFDWDRLRLAYDLAGVPGLRRTALDGLLSAQIGPQQTAAMSDEDLLSVNGVGPVSVRTLRAVYPQPGVRSPHNEPRRDHGETQEPDEPAV